MSRPNDTFRTEEIALPFGVNDAVLDWKILRGAERPFTSLTSLSDILCLFSLIEATAIYDTLWVAPADIGFFKALKPLVDHNIVRDTVSIPDRLTNSEVKEQFGQVASMLRYGEMARLSEVGAVDQATEPTYARYIFASNNRIDSVLDPVLTSYVPLVLQQSMRTLTSRLSSSLSQAYRHQIEALVEGGAPIAFYIPPAPAVILDRSSGSQEKIIKELLVIRDEFSLFRDKYRQYQHIINNPSEFTPTEMSKALREGLHEVESAIKELDTARTGSRLISDIFDVSLSGSDSGISISKSFGSLVKGLWQSTKAKIIRGRAQCLFDLWQNANNVRSYDTMLHRHFDLEKTALTQDADLVKKLGIWIDHQVGIKRQQIGEK